MFNSETLLMMQDQPYFSKIDKISDREEQGTFYFQNETGYGKIEVYRILPGFELHYNDINMSYMDEGLFYGCDDKDNDIIEINHCSRGRCLNLKLHQDSLLTTIMEWLFTSMQRKYLMS